MRSFVLALLLCWSALTGAAPATLKFSAVDSWTMPLADFHDSQLKGGILNDIIQRLSQRLGLDASVQVLPRNRVELAARQGSIDVRCYVSPAWISDHQRFLWSVPLFLHRDLIVAAGAKRRSRPRKRSRASRSALCWATPTPACNH